MPRAVKVSTARAKAATTAVTDWSTKATPAVAVVTNNRALYNIIVLP
jgi:hypothetical protein